MLQAAHSILLLIARQLQSPAAAKGPARTLIRLLDYYWGLVNLQHNSVLSICMSEFA